jgi:hypothetical protein
LKWIFYPHTGKLLAVLKILGQQKLALCLDGGGTSIE